MSSGLEESPFTDIKKGCDSHHINTIIRSINMSLMSNKMAKKTFSFGGNQLEVSLKFSPHLISFYQ